MKKLLLITVILLLQSFPSFGNPNGKGILCVVDDKELKEIFPKEHHNLLKFGFSFNDNKVTFDFLGIKNDVFFKESGKPTDFVTSMNKIEWGNTYERWELNRKTLELKEISKTELKKIYECEVYSQKIYLEKFEEMRKTFQNLNSIKLKDNKI